MLSIMLFAALPVIAASPPAPAASEVRTSVAVPAARKDCRDTMLHMTEQPGSTRARRLDQLPPGRLELTVMRQVGGCPIPAVLREGIGGAPQLRH